MFYALLAEIVVFVHFLYVAFVVLGEFFIIAGAKAGWDWIRSLVFRIPHIAAISIVAVQSIIGMLCPLTVWEYRLREAAGQTAEWEMTFLSRIFRRTIFYDFPDWFFSVLYIGFAVIVLATYIFIPPKIKKLQ